jgi:hypothetical protein
MMDYMDWLEASGYFDDREDDEPEDEEEGQG